MIIKNLRIVTLNGVIENGYIEFSNGMITNIGSNYEGLDAVDGNNQIAMPGFIDIHTHGSCGIDFMDASKDDYKTIAEAFYSEGITSFLATTLTSDFESMKRVCETVAEASLEVKSLAGIHLEGPYINKAYKGAQNEDFIRQPSVEELAKLVSASNNNIRLISMAPEVEGSNEFIAYATGVDVTISAGHTNATFKDIEDARSFGLTNITHTHNAMSKYDHKNPGVVNAAIYFDDLYTECICDAIHVHPNTLRTFYKVVGADRFMIITDALLAKHSDVNEFKLFNLNCQVKNGAAYLLAGNLAGSLLTMDQGIRNVRDICKASLVELAKISSYNQAKSLRLHDRGVLEVGKIADMVILSNDLYVQEVYKLGEKVYTKK